MCLVGTFGYSAPEVFTGTAVSSVSFYFILILSKKQTNKKPQNFTEGLKALFLSVSVFNAEHKPLVIVVCIKCCVCVCEDLGENHKVQNVHTHTHNVFMAFDLNLKQLIMITSACKFCKETRSGCLFLCAWPLRVPVARSQRPCRRARVSKRKPDALRCFLFCQSWKSDEPPFSPTVSPSDTTTILKKTRTSATQIEPEHRRTTAEPHREAAQRDGTALRRGLNPGAGLFYSPLCLCVISAPSPISWIPNGADLPDEPTRIGFLFSSLFHFHHQEEYLQLPFYPLYTWILPFIINDRNIFFTKILKLERN